MTNKNNFKLAIPTDAISMDIETSFLVGLDWGINSYELKRLFNKRLPSFEKSDIEYIKNSVKKKIILKFVLYLLEFLKEKLIQV